jgi:hypothetical protein
MVVDGAYLALLFFPPFVSFNPLFFFSSDISLPLLSLSPLFSSFLPFFSIFLSPFCLFHPLFFLVGDAKFSLPPFSAFSFFSIFLSPFVSLTPFPSRWALQSSIFPFFLASGFRVHFIVINCFSIIIIIISSFFLLQGLGFLFLFLLALLLFLLLALFSCFRV